MTEQTTLQTTYQQACQTCTSLEAELKTIGVQMDQAHQAEQHAELERLRGVRAAWGTRYAIAINARGNAHRALW